MSVSLRTVRFLFAGAALATLAGSVSQGAAGPARLDDFMLGDQNFIGRRLYKMADDKAVVLISYAAGDTAFKADVPAFKALKDTYEARKVEFLIVDSKLGETRDAVAADQPA